MGQVDSTPLVGFTGAGRDEPLSWGRSFWPALQNTFGLLFALSLIWGILAFPWIKGMPAGYVPVALGAGLAVLCCRRGVAAGIETALTRPAERRFVVGVVAAAVGVRVLAVLLLGDEPVGDHQAYNRHALQMLRGQGYGPTAYFPPGMSFWLLGVYALFGESLLAAQLVNALVGGLFTWLTYYIGKRVVPASAARLAAVLTAVFPSLVLYATTVGYDPLLGCTLLGVAALFLHREPATRHPWWYVAGIGVLLGVGTFLKPIGLLLPLVFGLAYRRRGASIGRSIRNTVIMTVLLFVVISPWSVRNYRLFGEYVPITTSGGVGLWVANNPRATGLSCPIPSVTAECSEVQRDRLLWKRAWRYITANPRHFAKLVLAKAAYLWGTSTTVMAGVSADRWDPRAESLAKLVINVAWAFVCSLFVVAVVRDGFCRSTVAFWPLIALLAYLWGIHQFYEAQSRYHLPLVPVLFLGAAAALLGRGSDRSAFSSR